jgi:hypothetical protein
MRVYGVPAEVLTDNGKQFTGRFTKPRPAEVLFERVCRENGITQKLTKPYSPTTTGKIERWHATLRRELLDTAEPFVDLPSAQAAISAWVHTYNHSRPHQAIGMANPASLFRPGAQPEPLKVTVAQPSEHEATPAPAAAPTRHTTVTTAGALEVTPSPHATGVVLSPSAGAVEFDTVIAPSGQLNVLSTAQRIRMGAQHAGLRAHVWADEHSVHVLVDGQLVKTVPSNLTADDLHHLRMRGALPAGPPPAASSAARTELAAGAVVEVDRSLDSNGATGLAGHRLKVGPELASRKVTLRLDGHLVHVVHDGVLAKTLPSPIPADQRPTIRGARIAATQLPPPPAGPVSVQRKVPRDGVIMVARQRLRVGRTYADKIVNVHVEDTHFRITCEGTEISLHPRDNQHPVRRWKAKIHAPKL